MHIGKHILQVKGRGVETFLFFKEHNWNIDLLSCSGARKRTYSHMEDVDNNGSSLRDRLVPMYIRTITLLQRR